MFKYGDKEAHCQTVCPGRIFIAPRSFVHTKSNRMLSWQSKRNSLRDKLKSGSSFSPLQTRLVAPQSGWQTAAFGMPQESVNPVTPPSCDCNVSQLRSGILKKKKTKTMQIHFYSLAAGETEGSCNRNPASLCKCQVCNNTVPGGH